MPRSTTELVVMTRSIRAHLLNVQEGRGPAATPTGSKKELYAAAAELTVLINMLYPADPEGGGDPAQPG